MTAPIDGPDQTATARIRALNVRLRTTFTGGQVLVTRGISALPADTLARVLAAVRAFDAFNADNNPWGEHDVGAFDVSGHRIFFKIDYLSADSDMASDDPTDASQTRRIMTIMLAEEY